MWIKCVTRTLQTIKTSFLQLNFIHASRHSFETAAIDWSFYDNVKKFSHISIKWLAEIQNLNFPNKFILKKPVKNKSFKKKLEKIK